ncbi:MAG: hypothetical protein RJA10_3760 [Pseudomonadota bacterium]
MHSAVGPTPSLEGPLLELARRDVPGLALAPTDTLFDAARLMAAERVGFVPVLGPQGQALGVVTEALLLAAAYGPQGPAQAITDVMGPAVCVPQDIGAAAGFQRCLAEGGAPLLLVDATQRVVAMIGESEFRARLQLAVAVGRNRVSALMARVQRPLAPGDTLAQAIEQMRQGGSNAVVVAEGTRADGVLTSRDVARLLAAGADTAALRLDAVMSRPVLSLPMDASIHEAAQRMMAHHVRHLVVQDGQGHLVGVVDEHELTRAMAVQVMDTGIEHERLRQRALLDAIPDPVWLKDPDGVFITCNPRFERLYGAPEAQIRGRTDHDFVSREQADLFRMHDLRAVAQGRPCVNDEELVYADDGHRERVQTIKSPVFDAGGRLLGVLGIARDITALRQAEEEYRWLFDGNPAPMYVFDRASLALMRVNQAFCDLYGYTEAEALALHLTDLYPPDDHDNVHDIVKGSSGLVDVGERRHQRRDGRQVQVVVRSHDTRLQDRACRVTVVTDVTQLHRSRLRDRQRMALMERLAQGEPLASLLDQLARDHEALYPGSLCSVLLLSDDGRRLHHGAAPSLPPAYVQAIDGEAIGPDLGSCGAAAHGNRRVVVADIDTHPNWQAFLPLAQAAGLRACWSEPIRGNAGAVLGTFAVYRREPGEPEAEELDHMQFAVQLAATAITQGGTTRALRDSQRRLDQVLQAIPDMVWQKDLDGVYRTCNAAFSRLAGLPMERIVGHRDEDITEASRAAVFRRQDEQVLATRQPLSLERWMTIRATGQHMLTELIKTPLFDDDGRLVGVLGVARDITLIKRGARAIAEQQQLMDAMLAQTTDAIVLVDPATLGFVTFNDVACQGLGYGREAFAKLVAGDLHAEPDLAGIREHAQRAMAGEQVRFDTQLLRADGGIQHAALTLRRITYGGRSWLSCVWRDVTEDRRRQARVERLNRSYDVLSAVNEAVVHLREREALFAEVCRITTQVGGFNLAWIGQVDEDDGHIVALGESGQPAGYVQQLRLSAWNGPDAPAARGLIAQALSAGTVQAVQDIETSPEVMMRRQLLLSHGHRSLAVFPILPAGGERLVLVVYSGTPGHFDEEQIGLFKRLAQDLAFALEFIAAQQARDEAQRFREQLIESVAGLFFALDPAGRLVLWNRRLQELTGYGPEELVGKDAADFFMPREWPMVAQRLRDGLEQGEMQVEARLISRDGRRTPHLLVARRLDMAQGPLLVGTGIDISARVRSERRLARYGDQLGFLVQRRTAELVAVNAQLHREDRRLRAMLALSQSASSLSEDEIFRRGLDEILSLTGSAIGCLRCVEGIGAAGAADVPHLVLRAWAGMDAPPPDGLARQVLQRAEACAVEGDDARGMADGHDGIQRLVAAPVLEDGRVALVVCAANKSEPYAEADVRELQLLASDLWGIVQRRRTEIALGEAKVAADAANQAKSAFLANMSHEIRTPMNAVIGFAHLLRRDPLTPRQQDQLAKITDASQHLMQVINDILDFSKIEAQKVTLERADFSLTDSLGRVRAMQLDAARSKQLPLVLQVAPDVPAVLNGDRLRLEQVLLNLLSNAVKFTPAGRVGLKVQPLAPPATGATWLRFEVVDTGIGMTAEQLDHVFEAFAQADVSTTRRFGGTGLGLAISKRLVQLMNGRIGAISQPDQGSTFWVELPFQPAQNPAEGGLLPAAAAAAAPAAAAQPAALRGLRVLVAEDNPINQEVTATLLGALGVDVDLVASGEEVLRTFDAQRHDLVLMDVQMPGMDGLRATAALRQRDDGRTVPIIAMTANAFAEDRQQCLEAGMNDHLAKPVEPQALEQCLRRWHRARAAASEAALRQRLLAAPGLDLRSSLARMRGAWPLYLRTLRMFLDHHAGDADRLAQLAADADRDGLRALAHSLAGASATIGAVQVQRHAQALQQQLDGGQALADGALHPLGSALQDLLAQVHAALQAVRDDAPVAAPPLAVARQAARAALRQLQPLVDAHDTAALALFERHRAHLETALGPRAQDLARELGNFSFVEAQRTLAQALQRLEAAPDAG